MHINFKVAARRSSALLGAVGLVVGVGSSAIPAFTATASADALNPLTQRSLTLSSSAPGYENTDGSGNSTYAYPGSGANGQKTSNYYSFNVSSTKGINAMTFQYCTAPAGDCVDPGDDSPHGTDTSSTSDLNVVTSSPSEISQANWSIIKARTEPNPQADPPTDPHAGMPMEDNSEGNFVVLTGAPGSQVVSPGWTMTATNQEESGGTTQVVTSANNHNLITLTNTLGPVALTSNEHIEVIFFATNSNYITNPGSGSFFVKINDYNDSATTGSGDTDGDGVIDNSETPLSYTAADVNPITGSGNIVDGGVTVANVMNESIEIQTKVLETMQFSVGTVDPDTLTSSELATAGGSTTHGACDNILGALAPGDAQDVLYLGNHSQENALSTSDTFGTHSYWRLSSNSSAGATVYYSGDTLHDTEGDQIQPMGTTAEQPQIGTSQFGLALDNDDNNVTNDYYGVNADNGQDVDPVTGTNYDTGADSGTTNDGAVDPTTDAGDPTNSTGFDYAIAKFNAHDPELYPLIAQAPYNDGGAATGASATGTNSSVFNPDITSLKYGPSGTVKPNGATDFYNSNVKFAFDPNANTVPAVLATENTAVVDCVTGKMRYVANIAATTPAGIYTTKINYIAAPQY